MGRVVVSHERLSDEEILTILKDALRVAGHPVDGRSLDRSGLFSMFVGDLRATAKPAGHSGIGESMTGSEELDSILKLDAFTSADRTAILDSKVQPLVVEALENRRNIQVCGHISTYVRSSLTGGPGESLSTELQAALEKIDSRFPVKAHPLV
jgi:hypothetical protein